MTRVACTILCFLAVSTACSAGPGEARSGADRTVGEAPPAAEVPTALAPSFDCGAASGAVEALICATPALAALDLRLDSVWTLALDRFAAGGAPEADLALVRAEQRGWIGGRDECWKTDDAAACTQEAYRSRIAVIETAYGLVEGGAPTLWSCEGNPANEFVVTFVPTDPPAARIERGDRQEVFLATPAGSGARYLGTFGKEAWFRGDEATFVWPQTDTLACVAR